MCGIAGILNFNDQPVSKTLISDMLEKIAHRGRDFSRVAIGSKTHNEMGTPISQCAEIGFGHNRLSIIDLNDSASQPMFYAENTLCITYNGEIFNYLELRKILEQKAYSFKTQSDTEILLAAYDHWGDSCVQYLNGMFAFAIWDEKNKKLFCARDSVGIKPFYYRLTDKSFAFASEPQALTITRNTELNYTSLLSYFLSMYVTGEESIYTGIKKLPPGHMINITMLGRFSIKKFWSINQFQGIKSTDVNIEDLSKLIQTSVTNQLRCNVPIGGFLSGGIDSGLITAIAAPQVKKYHTYSVGYEGLPVNELPFARKIAERYQTQHTEMILTANDAFNLLNKALGQMCEPIADPAMAATYILSELAAKDGVKVLLNGTGGDEIFAGYTRYNGQLSFKRRLINNLPRYLKNYSKYFPINHKLKSRLLSPELDMLYSTGGSYQLAQEISPSDTYLKSFINDLQNKFRSPIKMPSLYRHMMFDLNNYLPDQLLLLLDQMTMAHTIEGRVPLLDNDIIQFAFRFNVKEHIKNGQLKNILKKIAEPYLGVEHIYRKKQGFAGSSDWWVNQRFSDFIEVVANIRHIPYFETFNIDKIIKEKSTNEIFLLYCFCIWHKRIKSFI